MNSESETIRLKHEQELADFAPIDADSAKFLKKLHLNEKAKPLLTFLNKKVTDDPTHDKNLHYPSPENEFKVQAYVYKGDLKDGLSKETPIWLLKYKFTLFRGAQVNYIRNSNDMAYRNTYDMLSTKLISFPEEFATIEVTMVNDDLKQAAIRSNNFIVESYQKISDALKKQYNDKMLNYPNYILGVGRNEIQHFGKKQRINNIRIYAENDNEDSSEVMEFD